MPYLFSIAQQPSPVTTVCHALQFDAIFGWVGPPGLVSCAAIWLMANERVMSPMRRADEAILFAS